VALPRVFQPVKNDLRLYSLHRQQLFLTSGSSGLPVSPVPWSVRGEIRSDRVQSMVTGMIAIKTSGITCILAEEVSSMKWPKDND